MLGIKLIDHIVLKYGVNFERSYGNDSKIMLSRIANGKVTREQLEYYLKNSI